MQMMFQLVQMMLHVFDIQILLTSKDLSWAFKQLASHFTLTIIKTLVTPYLLQ